MTVIGWVAALALALQGTAPAATPLVPTGKWQVAFEDDLCVMSRSFGDGPTAMTLAFRPFPMNDRAEVAILVPSGKTMQREGAAKVAFSPGRTLPATFNAFGAAQDVRIVHVYLDRSLLGELASANAIAVTADGRSLAFAVPNAAAGLRVLDQCEVSLLKEWGVDTALKTGPLARAKGNPAGYFGPSAYPVEALRADQQGRVVALLSISEQGGVSECRVVQSSRAPSLDNATCRIARQHLRFTPAVDGAGRPIASHYLLPVRWQLPS